MGFRVVSTFIEIPKDMLKNTEVCLKMLQETLTYQRQHYVYEIDGLIIHTTSDYVRNTSKNPKYAIAFKEDTETQATVVAVLWKPSQYGALKPRIQIEPTFLCGVTITYVNGHNAAFIRDNKIGPGTVITLVRSGDVIPKVMDVVTPTNASLPKTIPYKWGGDTGMDIYTTDISTEQTIQQIKSFIKGLEIMNVSDSTIRVLVKNGYDTILKIIKATSSDFKKIDGFQDKRSERTYNCIQEKLQDVDLAGLMACSGCFGYGMGKVRMSELLKHIPDLLNTTLDDDFLFGKIVCVEGFSDILARKIVDNLPSFKLFLEELKPYIKLAGIKTPQKGKLTNLKIVMSGFRDQSLATLIEQNGGKVTTSVSKNTHVVITTDKSSSSSKVTTAKELKLEILTPDEFTEKYLS
jgi:NAD-dependent DNA ligase